MDWACGRERLAGAIFAPLAPAVARLPADRWPTRDELNAIAAEVATASGVPLRFVTPRGPGDPEARYYEVRIAEAGEVETRPDNWHDLFNALAWITWPRAKAAINAQHVALLREGGPLEARRRSPARDALTLYDEGGIAVASSDAAVFERIRGFRWKELFWERRADLERTTRFFVFGHGCNEQALSPYLGMVAKTVFVPVDAGFATLDAAAQVACVDQALAAHFADRARFASPKLMAPMPVLGVPGWDPRTAEATFYDDRDYFRASRRLGSDP